MLHPFGAGLQYNDWSIEHYSLKLSATSIRKTELEARHKAQTAAETPLTLRLRARHSGEFERSSVVVHKDPCSCCLHKDPCSC